MQIGLIARRSRATRCFVGILLLCAALLPAVAGSAGTPSRVKLAIFDFELEDLTAGPGESPADTLLLKQISSDARRTIANSGRYSLVDVIGADAEAVTGRWLHRCHGCDAGVALKLGAEQSFVGFVTRISRAEYTVRIQLSDTKTAAVISDIQTGLRMGADDSLNRAVGSLINGRLLSNQIATSHVMRSGATSSAEMVRSTLPRARLKSCHKNALTLRARNTRARLLGYGASP